MLKENIIAQDNSNNLIKTGYAKYKNISQIFETLGSTILITSKKYTLEGSDFFFDSKNKIIKSKKNSV